MKGIYLRADPADPDSPLWMLHLSSLTLARLYLSTGPGPHRLQVDAETPPPEAALIGFGQVLDSIVPGASENLLMATSPREDSATLLLNLASADGSAGFLAYGSGRGMACAIGITLGHEPIGPVWSQAPPADEIRGMLISTLVDHALSEIDLSLESPGRPAYVPALWLDRPDIIARKARTAPR